MKKLPRIFLHLPSYRDPELVPTIEDALKQAKHPERLVFGICRQYFEEDGFDNVDKYRDDPRFKIIDMEGQYAKGLPYARSLINELLLKDEEYILQLDSHHRFIENWDEILIGWHSDLEEKGHKPIITGYLPHYSPLKEDEGRADVPWQQQFVCFYPHGTIFIRPAELQGWRDMEELPRSRFLSGHFCFARGEWAKEVRHDPDIFFSGEELHLTVRSFTHGYDFFHPHRVVIWHSTMREERNGMLVWDDQHKRGDSFHFYQTRASEKIRNLLRTQSDPHVSLTNFDLGSERTLHDYELYSGVCFSDKSVTEYTFKNQLPPNPVPDSEEEWRSSLKKSFYHLVHIDRDMLPRNDYDFILLAFDDKNNNGVYSREIKGYHLEKFLEGEPIHFEEFFLVDEEPSKVVYWGHSNRDGWCERHEIVLKNG